MPEPQPPQTRPRDRFIRLALFSITALVFCRVLFADFVRFDDDQTIYRNPNIHALDFDRLYWMLTNADHAVRYKPLSWLVYAITYQFSGLNAWGYHAVSLLFHCLNTILLFAVVRRILRLVDSNPTNTKTSALDFSAGMAALLWAVNPLRVEAVAWVTTFSYALSFFFVLLSLWYYLQLGQAESGKIPPGFFYKRSVVMFALAMLSFPFAFGYVLILMALDWYPLRRINWASAWWHDAAARRVALEKIPFALLGGLIFVTLWARANTTGIWAGLPSTQNLNPIKQGIQASYAWGYYLWKPWLPFELSPMYDKLIAFNPREWIFLLHAAVAFGLTALVWWRWRQWRGVLVLWVAHTAFLLTAFGLTERAHVTADRYSYIPGLVWATGSAAALWWLLTHRPEMRKALVAITAALAVVWGAMSFQQTRHWKNSETLFGHMLQAMGERHAPSSSIMQGYLAMHFEETGRTNEAIRHYELAVNTFHSPPGHYGLANLLAASGDYAGAATNYAHLIAYNDDPLAHLKYGDLLLKQGRTGDAIGHYRAALNRSPDFVLALDGLAWALATAPEEPLRNGPEAVALAERACALTGGQYAKSLQTLGAAYARTGRLAEAVACSEQALKLATAAGDAEFARQTKALVELYQSGRAYPPGQGALIR